MANAGEKIRTLLLIGVVVFAAGCIIVGSDDDASLTIENRSDYVLVEVRVSPLGAVRWGPNLLRGSVLFPGEAITVFVDCGVYDVLVVDELDTACVLARLDLCFSDDVWVLTNRQLAQCSF